MSALPCLRAPSHLPAQDPEADDLISLYLLRFDRPNTRRAYRQDLETFFGTSIVTLDLARSATFRHVNQFIADLEAEGKSSATIRRRTASLRGFFSWLIALGALSLNPADRQLVRRISNDDSKGKLMTVLSAIEAAQMLDSIDLSRETGVRDHALLSTLLHCVLRRSEAAAMDVEHVRRLGDHWVLDIPSAKGGSGQSVKIPTHVANILESHKRTYGYTSGPIWRSMSRNRSRGQRLSATSIYMIVNRISKASGIQGKVGAHTMRHTGCTLAIEGGASIQQVQTHARHKNIETTMRYVHQRDKLANSAADFIKL
ncbi:MAG: tyrosine-type recombinase/integrase [Bacteroidota bacterium]